MPEYSVKITLSGRSRPEIQRILRNRLGRAVAQQARIVRADTPPEYDAVCLENGHLGCVHWTDEDIRNKLEELGIGVTPSILDAAKCTYALRHIDDRMIELGWDLIELAIRDTTALENIS
jgi:hypothetical protein